MSEDWEDKDNKRISFKKKQADEKNDDITNRDFNKRNISYEELPDGVSATINQHKVVADALEYIRKCKDGEIERLKTGYHSIDWRLLNGGFEPNTILALSGLSGSGKSALSKHLIYSINDYYSKRHKKVKTLCFNFEMLALKTVGREIAKTTRIGLTELYSSKEKLDEDVYKSICDITNAKLKKYDIRYVERPSTVDNLLDTIKYYWNKDCKDLSTTYIVEIDHTMLTLNKSSQSDKDKVDSLMNGLVAIKKHVADKGGNIFFIVISQMNRDIKNPERIKNTTLHRPQTSDLFQSSNVEFCSDYILIAHNPLRMNFQSYTELEYPVSVNVDMTIESTDDKGNVIQENVTNEGVPFIYFHLLKNRDGEPDGFIPMISDLKYFNYIELSASEFRDIHEQNRNQIIGTYNCTVRINNTIN